MTLYDVKLIHTLITLVNTGAVAYILYCGVRRREGPLLDLAIFLIMVEALALAAFEFRCPVQYVARAVAGTTAPVNDIFLPRWVAAYIVQACVPFAIVGLALVWRNRRTGGVRNE
ncbi:MAG: hypothetical protein AAF638_12560 [Pseudomonadota bacterium]